MDLPLKFSIVIPTYNEEHDIGKTLDCLIALDYKNFEVLVIDDSTDSTPDIVSCYGKFGVELIRPETREGRCGARNIGILKATGDVVVILNADVHLPVDFLNRIHSHYMEGADYVLVRSDVKNLQDLFARYVNAVSIYDFYSENPQEMEWTEGFSCRRETAIAAGLFPSGFSIPLVAGEDKIFGENLKKIGARKIVDLSIVCQHIAPASLSEYWHIRKGRGEGAPQVRYFIQDWGVTIIFIWALLRLMKTIFLITLIFPTFFICYKYSRISSKKMRDLMPFCWAWIIEQISFNVGELQSLKKIIYTEKFKK
jgi:glycosyltransferase involved in cell wall biosynthesis